jgi:hypothetical protein
MTDEDSAGLGGRVSERELAPQHQQIAGRSQGPVEDDRRDVDRSELTGSEDESLSMGARTRRSVGTRAIRHAAPTTSPAMTRGLVHPTVGPAVRPSMSPARPTTARRAPAASSENRPREATLSGTGTRASSAARISGTLRKKTARQDA